MPDKAWPPYRVGNPEHIHALGVIASVFNLLEFNFRQLFNLYLRLPSSIAYALFAKISNEMRLDLANRALDYSPHPNSIKDHVRHFLAGFRACAENRNILMHSVAMFFWDDPNAERCPVLTPHIQPDAVAFQKTPKDDPFKINIYTPTIAELRGIADSIKSFEDYGDRLYWYILQNCEPEYFKTFRLPDDVRFALPDRPAQPTLLIPTREAPKEPL
jgi:hypothetical protein